MAVFHQMGHHSNNLLDLPEMSAYAGAIFSPVNSTKKEVTKQIGQVSDARKEFETVFDPQLYAPVSKRKKLKKWPYFPKGVDTANRNPIIWWNKLNRRLADTCRTIEVNAVCTPAIIPKVYDDKYYSLMVDVGSGLVQSVKKHGIRVLQTVIVGLPELAVEHRALEVASIVSRTDADRVYLVLVSSSHPRRELSDVDELKGAMQLINALERNEIPVLISCCSSDLLLWKSAGASACASGKFFNLRRFTRQRFEESKATGGGQLPHWFEEGLLAFLRGVDIKRIRNQDLLSEASQRNPFCQEVLNIFDEATRTRTEPEPWLRISWRQFLYWFADVEARLDSGDVTAEDLLKVAVASWSKLDDAKIHMEDRQNDGAWIPNWLNTLSEYEAQRP